METIAWCGSTFKDICPESTSVDLVTGDLFKEVYVTAEGYKMVKVGALPFVPTFTTVSSKPHGSWYNCSQLSEEENNKLNLCYIHWEGSQYITSYERTPNHNWIGAFFSKVFGDNRYFL